jgi:hypothetical protein
LEEVPLSRGKIKLRNCTNNKMLWKFLVNILTKSNYQNIVNYDTEYDKLRRIILSIINDILSETEPTLQRILFENLGDLSVFFGRKMTIDNLIPLSNSCFNKKDFMLRVS